MYWNSCIDDDHLKVFNTDTSMNLDFVKTIPWEDKSWNVNIKIILTKHKYFAFQVNHKMLLMLETMNNVGVMQRNTHENKQTKRK